MARKKSDGAVKVVRVNEPGGELLDVRYFCKVDDREKLNVVINLKASTNIAPSQVPQRYVLLIDVSGSMNDEVKGDNRSLLERVKIFGYLFVDNLTEGTWISIVTFSNTGETILPMTIMDKKGRRLAKKAISNLKTVGMTNISDGLFESLNAIQSSQAGELTRDCIILFTDGQANEGITEATVLVNDFKRRVKEIDRSNGIPVSAITIGDNQPFFLNQVASALGSDSFYWLNETGDFEADMLLPMLLRESPSISDVVLELACQNEVTFLQDTVPSPSLQSMLLNSSRTYLIHFIPSGMERNIYLSLNISGTTQETDGKIILEVWKSFFDSNLNEHTSTDYLELRLTSMKQAMYDAYQVSKNEESNHLQRLNLGPDALKYLQSTSSYTASKNQTKVSWEDAQESMVNVLGQQCRLETISAIEASAELVDRGQDGKAQQSCQQALSNIESIEKITEDVLGKNSPHCKSLQDNVKQNFGEKLKFVSSDMRNFNPGRLTAMASSFSTEMPTATEVFNPGAKQPFMPKEVDKKHDNCKQIVSEISQRAKENGDYGDLFASDSSSIASEPPEVLDIPEETPILPPVRRVIYVTKPRNSEPEEYDPDSLFLASILPDLQKVNEQKKLEIKMDILRVIHNALYTP